MKLSSIKETLKHYYSFVNYDLANIYLNNGKNEQPESNLHIKAAVEWLCRAQDAFSDGGVARSFLMIYSPYFKRKGWVSSYPETTGYIIPTMFEYAALSGDEEIFTRAVRMADWECDVQMADGAVMGGTVDQKASPAIFNTGQVIFGWLRAYKETQKERYLDSAVKAGDYLIANQDDSGAWMKKLSDYTHSHMRHYTYNTRTAWALLLLSGFSGNAVFREGAIRNIEFALTEQTPSGWFKNNCLFAPQKPLLHTIAYSVRGILESGILLKEERYIQKAKMAAEALMSRQRADGSLAGQLDERWQSEGVSYSCLTGDAQTAIIWGRLYEQTRDSRYLESMRRMNKYLRGRQIMHTRKPGLYGGLAGSDPLHGLYGRFEILNWAVKFLLDALMLESSINGANVESGSS